VHSPSRGVTRHVADAALRQITLTTCRCGCHSDEASRDVVEQSSQTLSELVHGGHLVVVAGHVTYVANDINAVSVQVRCPPNWAPVVNGNETACGSHQRRPLHASRFTTTTTFITYLRCTFIRSSHLNAGSRVVSMLDSGAEGPGFKSQPRRCRVAVLGKLFTPIVPHQAAKLVAVLLRVARVTAGLVESNGSLLSGL